MKKMLYLILFSFYACNGLQAQQAMKLVFTVQENDLIPEGIAFDPLKNEFYVGSTYKRKIIRIDHEGRASDFIQGEQDGVTGVIGIRVDAERRYLWAVSSNAGNYMPVKDLTAEEQGQSGIFKYDLNSGKLLKKYILRQKGRAFFFNDLVVAKSGKVYITETMNGGIYTIDPRADSIQLYYQLPANHFPNGIDITDDQEYLFIAAYAQPADVFLRIRLKDKKIENVNLNNLHPAGADGLCYYNKSLIAVLPDSASDRITQFFLDDDLLNVKSVKVHIKNDPLFSQPTTGVVVGERFYYIATSNLQLFARIFRSNKGNYKLSELQPLRVGELKLD